MKAVMRVELSLRDLAEILSEYAADKYATADVESIKVVEGDIDLISIDELSIQTSDIKFFASLKG